MEDQDEKRSSENGREKEEEAQQPQEDKQKQKVEEENVLQFLDSTDSYLTLMDSLSSILRQGWLELASARHSMGTSRISSALFDLKLHSAATSLQVTQHDVVSMVKQPHFSLCKWASLDDGKCCPEEAKLVEDKLLKNSNSPQLRHRGTSQISELQEKSPKSDISPSFCEEPQEKSPKSDGSPPSIDDQVQKERSKSLSVFGTLVSPKLRAAQLSFETALETLVEIANIRSSMLSAFDQIRKEMEGIEQ